MKEIIDPIQHKHAIHIELSAVSASIRRNGIVVIVVVTAVDVIIVVVVVVVVGGGGGGVGKAAAAVAAAVAAAAAAAAQQLRGDALDGAWTPATCYFGTGNGDANPVVHMAVESSSSSSSSAFTKAGKTIGLMEQPWLEKYRPQVLDDVVGNEETIARLKVIADHGNLPNIIISGPPGTGKTTSIMCLAKQMLGDMCKHAVLELNASDDRGIDVVRNKIKMFSQTKVNLPPGRHKIIILDEADSMTKGAQQALRRTMEMYSDTTRFALACNISSKIIEPIQSRCAILRYSRLSDKQILSRVEEVLQAEGITTFDNSGLEAILFTAEGDMRNALNNLQSTFAGFGFINSENVFKVCDQPHPKIVQHFLGQCVASNARPALATIQGLSQQGYAASDIISTLFRVCKTFDMDQRLKLNFIREIGFAHMRIADGLDSLLQLTGLASRLCLVASGTPF